jgi:hypothetical protein
MTELSPAAGKNTVLRRLRVEMTDKIVKNGFAVVLISLVLLTVAFVIWLFVKEAGTPIQDVLFCVGAVPIVIFSVGVLGEYFKRRDAFRSPGRSASRQTPHPEASQGCDELASGITSGLNWVLAGAALMLVCYLL